MTAGGKRKPVSDGVSPQQRPVSKVLQDRIAADGEQVSHTLDPDREADTVRYRDPQAPHEKDDGQAVTPQSNAEIQMGPRTDAGSKEAARAARFADGSTLLVLGCGVVGLFLVIAALIALA